MLEYGLVLLLFLLTGFPCLYFGTHPCKWTSQLCWLCSNGSLRTLDPKSHEGTSLVGESGALMGTGCLGLSWLLLSIWSCFLQSHRRPPPPPHHHRRHRHHHHHPSLRLPCMPSSWGSHLLPSTVWQGPPRRKAVLPGWQSLDSKHWLSENFLENPMGWRSQKPKAREKQVYFKNKRIQRTRMQPRKTLLWNKLFQHSCTFFHFPLIPYRCTVDCEMWKGVECKVWSVKKVKCWVGNVVCRVWSGDFVKCGVWSVKCGVESVKCRVWSAKCKVKSVKCGE